VVFNGFMLFGVCAAKQNHGNEKEDSFHGGIN
jgi:hypothetical protein